MASVEETEVLPAATSRLANGFSWLETAISQASEHLNPIVVKEARQALKSRQFTFTFVLVLLAGWSWSIVGIAWMGPGVYWAAEGPSMFFGYYLILAFPLLVIVPFGAYRSLASEREDRTYELLSITTLRPRQIIAGKLAGATLQMMVYLSAILPCLAFTYLLRGIDVLTIGIIVVYLCLASLGLSMIGLLLATISSEKYQQVVLSVAAVFGLGVAFFVSCSIVADMLHWSSIAGYGDFWLGNACILSFYLTYFLLFFLAATAQISFANSNRSTPLRVAALLQQAVFLAWMGGIWYNNDLDYESAAVIAFVSGLHWFVMGSFMMGENGTLSARVKRELPQSFLGRAFLTWFNPGPGTGYMFALSTYLGVLVLIVMGLATNHTNQSGSDFEKVILMPGLCFGYLAVYLGLSRLILRAIAKYTQVTIALRILIPLFMVLLGTLVPLTIQYSIPTIRNYGYTALQVSNPFWTLSEVFDNSPATDLWASLVILLPVAAVVFGINFPSIADEVRQLRIDRPKRVAEEDAAIEAIALAEAARSSPWD